MTENQFTLPGFEGTTSWTAVRFGDPWNGFATPVVCREVLEDLLGVIGDGHRWEGDEVLIWATIDLEPDDEPQDVERLSPDREGLYDLGALGWVFERA